MVKIVSIAEQIVKNLSACSIVLNSDCDSMFFMTYLTEKNFSFLWRALKSFNPSLHFKVTIAESRFEICSIVLNSGM